MKTVPLLALFSIAYGSPSAPRTAAPGETFPCPADEAAGLVERGFAREPDPAAPPPPAPSPSEVQIPADWEGLNAADMIALARALGAPKSVDTKAEASGFVGRIAGERAAQSSGQQPGQTLV